MLFEKEIVGWDSWGKVFCDVEAFAPLVRDIYRQESMPVPEAIEGMTPGTNAVFRCGDTVVKIFAPEESGIDSVDDFDVESAMLAYLQRCGIPCSTPLASGQIADKYLFRYMIMAYLSGVEAGNALPHYFIEEKQDFGRQLRVICDKLNQPCEGLLPDIDLRERALHNPRLNALPAHLRADLRERVTRLSWDEDVVTHGDLTGENVLVMPDGTVAIIDTADAVLGPAYYELPPLVFELFRCDGELVKAFQGGKPQGAFIPDLLDGLALHDFGADIIREWAKREGIPLETLRTMEDIGCHLAKKWQ